jgi:hypothetical protein
MSTVFSTGYQNIRQRVLNYFVLKNFKGDFIIEFSPNHDQWHIYYIVNYRYLKICELRAIHCSDKLFTESYNNIVNCFLSILDKYDSDFKAYFNKLWC